MKKEILKNQKGFAGSDALIAVLIITLFAGLIATISYNIYLSNSSIKRMSKATSYIVDVFEYIDKEYYDDITADNLIQYFNGKYDNTEVKMKESSSDEELTTPYKAEITITKYNETDGNTDKLDLVQEITMTVTYTLGNKKQEITMTKTKTRENLTTPNKPELSSLNVDDDYYVYPIKYSNSTWIVCNENDSSWYNYESGKWALVIVTSNELTVNTQIDTNKLESDETLYAWLPRYAYDGTNIKFLFSNSNSYVGTIDEYQSLISIDNSDYIIPDDFSEKKELLGIWTNASETEAYTILNEVYPLKR